MVHSMEGKKFASLLLSSRQFDATFTNNSFILLWPLLDAIVQLSSLGCALDGFITGRDIAITDIGGDGIVKEGAFLRNDTQALTQASLSQVPNVGAVDFTSVNELQLSCTSLMWCAGRTLDRTPSDFEETEE